MNNFAAKHFRKLARDSAALDNTLKDLTKKLSKLTHKSAPPGSANTHNASTVQNPGVHEMYVQRLTGLSGQIQQVRKDHLAQYTKLQKSVDRSVARSSAKCCRQNYSFLSDALIKTGSADGIGGVNAWAVFASAGISPPILDLNAEAELDLDAEGEWNDIEEDDEQQPLPDGVPRPPSAFRDHSSSYMGTSGTFPHPTPRQGRMPSQASFGGYGGSPLPPQPSQQYTTQVNN